MEEREAAASRRGFLKLMGSAPMAGIVVIGGSETASAEGSSQGGGKKGFQETEHVRRFYSAARF